MSLMCIGIPKLPALCSPSIPRPQIRIYSISQICSGMLKLPVYCPSSIPGPPICTQHISDVQWPTRIASALPFIDCWTSNLHTTYLRSVAVYPDCRHVALHRFLDLQSAHNISQICSGMPRLPAHCPSSIPGPLLCTQYICDLHWYSQIAGVLPFI
jgi:hypothetical protein